AHPELDLLGRTRVAFRDTAETGHDLARGAEAALQALMFDEGGLERVKVVAVRQTFYRLALGSVLHSGKRQARDDPPAVQKNGARAAGALITPLLRAREIERFAQHVEQRLPRIDLDLPSLSIDGQPNAHHSESLLPSAHGGLHRVGRHCDKTSCAADEL